MGMCLSYAKARLKIVFLVTVGILLYKNSCAQDIYFSQFLNCPLSVSPAMAGEEAERGRFILNYRSQWGSITNNPYKTFGLSADRAVWKDNLFGGLQIIKDEAGDSYMRTTQINFSLAPKVWISSKDYLKMGITATWANRFLNTTNLTWNSQFDGSTINTSLNSGEAIYLGSINYYDFATGILWNHLAAKSNQIRMGFSTFHILHPSFKLTPESKAAPIKWVGHADASWIVIPSILILNPSILLMAQGPSRSYNVGMIAKYNLGINSKYTGYYKSSKVSIGTFYRHNDAITLLTGFEYKDQLQINISYDINISKLIVANNREGIEISLLYTIPKKNIIQLK